MLDFIADLGFFIRRIFRRRFVIGGANVVVTILKG